MSDTSRAWTWRHAIIRSSLPATTRHVLLTISCFMNDVGGGCYPTTKQLAEATGLSERAVCTHIANAVAAGWLKVSEHGFRGRKWKNHEYHAAWPVEEGTEARSVPNRDEALNVVPRGTEPDDNEALNVVQSTSPYTTPTPVHKTRARAATPRDELLVVLDDEHANAVMDHRKRIGKPLTAYAAKLLAKKFAKTPDPLAAADAMVANGWQGFEPHWMDRRDRAVAPAAASKPTLASYARALLSENSGQGGGHVIEHER